MKLTKGKIFKAYNKKNQTMKKYKMKKNTHNRTLGNKKPFNIFKSTMKNINKLSKNV